MGSIDDPLSLNRYVYCGLDPVNFVDPTGFHSITFSHDADMIYWIDDNGYIANSWECHDAFFAGTGDNGLPRASLPNGDYTANALTPGENYGRAYGTFYIDTGDSRGRDIHGGGSSLSDPFAARQGWLGTYGCLRMQNEDGQALSQLMIDHGNNISLTVQGPAYTNPTDTNTSSWFSPFDFATTMLIPVL
jgi:hypothetical protein